MSTFYTYSEAVQNPIAVGVDIKGRKMFSFNFRCQSLGLPTDLEDDMLAILSSAGLVIPNVTAFGSNATLPDEDGPFILLRDTGGSAPFETHNMDVYANLSLQIVVYAANYVAGRSLANRIWTTLNGKYNFTT
jgi:minor capsid protein